MISARKARAWAWALSLGLLATLGAGCAGEGATLTSDGGNPTPTPNPSASPNGSFAQIQRQIFDQNCTSSSCHSSATRSGNMSLAAGEAYDNLVNVEPDNQVARTAGLLRVKPSNPDSSFILRKLEGDLQPGEGSQMPLGAAPLPASEIDLIRQWIADGALPD
jgi:hypothetical protein